MEDFDILLPDGDLLSRVLVYELNRKASGGETQTILICVHQFLSGEHKGKFSAEPTDLKRQPKAQYMGVGDSAEEALKSCLTKRKGVSIDNILISRR
jgi:hypothetical protein